jgi:hypothetical protein
MVGHNNDKLVPRFGEEEYLNQRRVPPLQKDFGL